MNEQPIVKCDHEWPTNITQRSTDKERVAAQWEHCLKCGISRYIVLRRFINSVTALGRIAKLLREARL